MAGQLLQTVAHQGTSSVWSAGLNRAAGLDIGELGTGEFGMADEPVEQMVGVGAFKAFEQKQMPVREITGALPASVIGVGAVDPGGGVSGLVECGQVVAGEVGPGVAATQ